jgi:hypothetical protein
MMLAEYSTPLQITPTSNNTAAEIAWPPMEDQTPVRLVFGPGRTENVELRWGAAGVSIDIPPGDDNYTVDWRLYKDLPTHIFSANAQALKISVMRGKHV